MTTAPERAASPPAASPRRLSLSVVMPVHGGASFLRESVPSILAQTFEDFELVVLDDASDDETPDLLAEMARGDHRLRVVRSPTRLGVVGSANRVVAESRADVCARMDADDVSHPDRLRREWEVLREHPDAALVATLWRGIDAGGACVRPRDRWPLWSGSRFAPFPHGSIMFRRQAFVAAGGYREPCALWEDFDLYLRLHRHGRLMVIPEALYLYRFHTGSVRVRTSPDRLGQALDMMHRCLALQSVGQDYTGLLAAAPPAAPGGPGREHALFSLGWARLWAGESPGILAELRRLGGHPLRRPAAKAVLLGIAGTLSPRAVRFALRRFIRLRDLLAGRMLQDGTPVEWRFA